MPIKIALVGPESTGKSTLSQQLAKHFNGHFVPEFARTYIAQLNRPYTLNDIEFIAEQQLKLEERASADLLFCDTNLLVTKIWAEHAFGNCPEYIAQHWQPGNYHLHLLMNIDLPWQPDPLREHPHLRSFFFEWYERELKQEKVPYQIVSGNEMERFKLATGIVETLLNP